MLLVSKRESELKSDLMKELHRQCPHFVVQLFASAGSPDRSITGEGRTTHWEFKHGTPDFESPGLQELTCSRIDLQGHCRYVIWQETRLIQRTLIVRPRVLLARSQAIREGAEPTWSLQSELSCVGFDHRWLVGEIRKAHRV